MTLLITKLAFSLALAVITLVLVPLWAIINCLRSDLTKSKKALWVVLMSIIPLFAYIYGFITSKKSVQKLLFTLSLICVIYLIVSANIAVNTTCNYYKTITQQLSTKLNQEGFQISVQEKKNIESRLQILKEDMNSKWYQVNKKISGIMLIEFLEKIARDNKITNIEHLEWIEIYEATHII